MQVVIGKQIKQPKEVYEIIISTMEGDADDYHEIVFNVKTEAEAIERYKEFMQLRKIRNVDDYSDLPFWEDWEDQCHYSEYGDRYDRIDDFSVHWYDANGIKFKAKIKE